MAGQWETAHLTWYNPNTGSGSVDPSLPYDPTGGGGNYACGGTPQLHDMVVANDQLPCGTVVDIELDGKTVTCVVKDRFGSGQPTGHFDLMPAPAKAIGLVEPGGGGPGQVYNAQWRYSSGSVTPSPSPVVLDTGQTVDDLDPSKDIRDIADQCAIHGSRCYNHANVIQDLVNSTRAITEGGPY